MLDSAVSANTYIEARKGLRVPLELEEDEKKTLKNFADSLEDFIEKRASISPTHIIILCRLALEEGKSQRYYADKWSLPASTVSRAVLDLGKKLRNGDPGLGLIEEKVSPHSLREQEIYISVVGKTFLRKIVKKLAK